MRYFAQIAATTLAVKAVTAQDDFNVLQHLGGNGQWFPGPNVTGIPFGLPAGCDVEMVAFVSRHGSRFPDRGAYNEWTDLYTRLQAAPFNVTDPKLAFLKTWKPVLSDPEAQIAQLSPTGIQELKTMGEDWRLRYPDLYEANTPLTLWANYYKSGPRVRDSARYFAQGFLGANASSLGNILALNASDPSSFMNSLAPSDLCPLYADEGGSPYKDTWESIYLPPIRSRLNAMITGGFNFTQWDVSIIPYLCGFETQITQQRSPFCDIFTEDEILSYEYAQDLRYWYGAGLGTDIEKLQMLPVLDGLVQRFVDGPDETYTTSANTTFKAPSFMAAFSNDGQVSQLIAATGVFDDEADLPGTEIRAERLFRASRFLTMKGTVAFERLTCGAPVTGCKAPYEKQEKEGKKTYMRILLNDVVYPVANCASGPGSSCPLDEYQALVKSKLDAVGSYKEICNVTDQAIGEDRKTSTFWVDDTVEWAIPVTP